MLESALGSKAAATEEQFCLIWWERMWNAISKRKWNVQLVSVAEFGYRIGFVADQRLGRGSHQTDDTSLCNDNVADFWFYVRGENKGMMAPYTRKC